MQDADTSYFFGLVTFIDILGFRSMIEGEAASEILDKIQHLQKFTSSMDLYEHELPTPTAPFLRSISFSDSIVRVRAFGSEPSVDTVMLEIRDLVIAQAELARSGVLIRGGMTAGSIFISDRDNIAFGPAFVRAYEIESQLAVYPRIVIDPYLSESIYKMIEEYQSDDWRYAYPSYCGTSIEDWVSVCSSLGDDNIFINYLNGWSGHLDEAADWVEMLLFHKQLVEGKLLDRSIISNDRVLAKIIWLKSYHNFVVQECIRMSEDYGYGVDGDPFDYSYYLRKFIIS